MKVSPTADFPVRVLEQQWEDGDPLYAGIFAVTLNHVVDVAFVPDLSAIAPPWEDRLLPQDLDAVKTPEQARLATVLFTSYVVTPNLDRAGTDDVFIWGVESGDDRHIVYYVTPAEFDAHAADLAVLTAVAGNPHSPPRVSELRDQHPVVRFIEERIVASAGIHPRHAVMLGRA